MSWGKEKDFGVIKTEDKKVKLYSTNTSYSTVNIGTNIDDARWSGDSLLVYLVDGRVRRYSSQNNYSTVN